MMSWIRKDMFNKLMELPIRYYERRKTAPFIGRIQYDSETVQSFLTKGMTIAFVQVIMTGVIIVMLFVLDWRLTLIKPHWRKSCPMRFFVVYLLKSSIKGGPS
jgi:ABC-type bacteriocin/lantibiotic exporter with double-glycine peptidase domain